MKIQNSFNLENLQEYSQRNNNQTKIFTKSTILESKLQYYKAFNKTSALKESSVINTNAKEKSSMVFYGHLSPNISRFELNNIGDKKLEEALVQPRKTRVSKSQELTSWYSQRYS
jgi:hypothetical protein